MSRRHRLAALFAGGALLLAVAAGPAQSQSTGPSRTDVAQPAQVGGEQPARERAEQQTRQRIYGEELMSGKERDQYRERMQAMKTERERAQFEAQHRREMQQRAQSKHLALAEDGTVVRPGTERGQPGRPEKVPPPRGGERGPG